MKKENKLKLEKLEMICACGKHATGVCRICGEPVCEYCQAKYNQFTQIDYNCCESCANRDPNED